MVTDWLTLNCGKPTIIHVSVWHWVFLLLTGKSCNLTFVYCRIISAAVDHLFFDCCSVCMPLVPFLPLRCSIRPGSCFFQICVGLFESAWSKTVIIWLFLAMPADSAPWKVYSCRKTMMNMTVYNKSLVSGTNIRSPSISLWIGW